MCTTTACVKDIHLGVFDKYLIPFAKSLKADGRQVRVLTLSYIMSKYAGLGSGISGNTLLMCQLSSSIAIY
jgi:hypothetical protein